MKIGRSLGCVTVRMEGARQGEPERPEYTWKGLSQGGRKSAHWSRELWDSETRYGRGLESNMGCKFVEDL